MNRRDFLRLSLLVPAALVVSIQEPVEKLWDIHYLEPNPANSPSRVWEEVGRQVMEGYVEGIQAPLGIMGNGSIAFMDSSGIWKRHEDQMISTKGWVLGEPIHRPWKFSVYPKIEGEEYFSSGKWTIDNEGLIHATP